MIASASEAATTVTYRPLSTLAVISGVLGALSVLAWIAPSLVALAAVAAICGSVAVLQLRGRSADVAGMQLAIAGCAVSSICLFVASLWHWHRYVIETPAGYERIELADIFNPQSGHSTADWVLDEQKWRDESTERQQRLVLGATVLQLNGHRVAVKGYIDPYSTHEPVSAFTMSRRGWTGFGSQAEPGEQLTIQLAEGAMLDYSGGPVVVSGEFHVETESSSGKTQVRLVLKNAVIRPATSTIGLPPRNGGKC